MARRRRGGGGLIKTLIGLLIAKPPRAAAPKPLRQPAQSSARAGEVIRFNEISPDRAWRRLCSWNQDLVGEQYHRVEIAAFAGGTAQTLEVVRERDNPHDPDALAVYGEWDDADGRRRGLLGYLPRELAAVIKAVRPDDLPIRAFPVRLFRRGDYLDLSLALFEPAASSAFWKERGGAPSRLAERF